MRKIYGFFSACLLCLIFLCSCGKEKSKEDIAYVSLDINPAIELIVDENQKVISVRGENEDGQVLLYDEDSLTGLNINQAIQKLTTLAIEYGYLDTNNQVVDTLVTSNNDKFESIILEKVNTEITATASNLGLTVKTDGEGAYSLLRKMAAFKAKYPNNKTIQNLSVQKFKLAVSVSETNDISLEVAVELKDEELIDLLKKATDQIEAFATETYLAAKKQAFAIYDKATEVAGYTVYTKYYIEKVFSHPLTAYYGGAYQLYATAAKSFSLIYEVANLTNSVYSYPLNQEQIKAILTSLGMAEEEIELLKDSNGNVTLNSIEAYADKMFKNTEASSQLNELKKKLTESLNEIESNIQSEVNELEEEHKEEIKRTVESVEQILASIENAMALLPNSIKETLNECTKDFKEIIATMQELLADGKMDLAELKVLADRLETKAQSYLEKIKADLSPEELKEIETKKEEIISKMQEERTKLETSLQKAEKAAKEELANLKAARKTTN